MQETKKAFIDPEVEIVELLPNDVVTTSAEDDWWGPEV